MCPVRSVTYVSGRSNHLQAMEKLATAECSGNCSGCASFLRFFTLPAESSASNATPPAWFKTAELLRLGKTKTNQAVAVKIASLRAANRACGAFQREQAAFPGSAACAPAWHTARGVH